MYNDESDRAFKTFLSDIAVQVDELNLSKGYHDRFQKHIDKVFIQAENYRKYILDRYENASKKWPIDYKRKPEGKDLFWYSAYEKHTTEYFRDDKTFEGGMIMFWMEEQPNSDPLSYFESMACGSGSAVDIQENLILLDYQYFFLACIHDSQRRAAGQTTIYFDTLDDKDFKNRICKKIYQYIEDARNRDTVKNIIQTALRDIQQTGGDEVVSDNSTIA
jgi:hypothetical protein